MQISEKYGLVYVITKLGLLFVYDLQTATAVYRNRISPDPIFLTASAPSTGGFYAINRWGLPGSSPAAQPQISFKFLLWLPQEPSFLQGLLSTLWLRQACCACGHAANLKSFLWV